MIIREVNEDIEGILGYLLRLVRYGHPKTFLLGSHTG